MSCRAPMPSSTRVVLAEDHALLRGLLRSTLAACPDLDVVGEAATAAEAVRLVRAVRPDVLVLDIQLAGDQDGVDVATRVAGGPCRVLAYSSHADPVHVAHLLRAGASGYLSKEAPAHRIVEAVRAVAAGESRWFEAGVEAGASLAPDELRALAHLATGGRPETLAQALCTSPGEALDVLARLYDQLGASSWYEALARGWAMGLIGPGRVREPVGARGYSIRAKRPGQARAARAGSYGA